MLAEQPLTAEQCADKIRELAGEENDFAKVVQDHPELAPGLELLQANQPPAGGRALGGGGISDGTSLSGF